MNFYIYKGVTREDAKTEEHKDRISIVCITDTQMSEDYKTINGLTEIVYVGDENTITFELDKDDKLVEVTREMVMERLNKGELPE